MRQFTIGIYKEGKMFPDKTKVIFKESYKEAEIFVTNKNKNLKKFTWKIDVIN